MVKGLRSGGVRLCETHPKRVRAFWNGTMEYNSPSSEIGALDYLYKIEGTAILHVLLMPMSIGIRTFNSSQYYMVKGAPKEDKPQSS